MPKLSYLELEDGQNINKCKGYSGKLTKAQYLELLNGRKLDLTINKWNRSLKGKTIQIQRSSSYSISFSFNKRNQEFENGVWANTSPIILGSREKRIN